MGIGFAAIMLCNYGLVPIVLRTCPFDFLQTKSIMLRTSVSLPSALARAKRVPFSHLSSLPA